MAKTAEQMSAAGRAAGLPDARDILRVSRIGLWRLDRENGEAVRLYGDAAMDELLGITGPAAPEERQAFLAGHIHPDDRELFAQYARGLAETPAEVVYRYIHPIRGELVIRCSGQPDPSAIGRSSSIGTHQDITDIMRLEKEHQAEQRLAEQNLTLRREQKQQENYYRELLDVQNCGLLAYTMPGHKVIHMNAEAMRMYDVRNVKEFQENLGSILSSVWYPDPQAVERLKRLRNTSDVVDYECVIHKGQPNECHAMAKTKDFRLPSGERAVVTTFLDVSDMILLRKALHQAEEGSRAKSAFLFAMSHDLRTPMNAILGYADLLESHWGEKQSWGYLQKLKQASRFLLGLIGNVLEVARIESGKETLHEAPWDLNGLRSTLDLLENDIRKKSLKVSTDICLPSAYVSCDSVKLCEVLMNLLSNAVKYTPEGGSVRLTIRELSSDIPGSVRLRMQVADNGIGIASEYLPHIFEAFSRERDSSESGILGTGLGLRIVKSFVDLMGGSIAVESELGKGSCFTVELPLRLAAGTACRSSAARQTPGVALAGRHILMAEDNALNAEITATILEDAGMTVDVAQNGVQAVEMLKKAPAGHYDLILMDIQMPRMNGYDAARAIRALPDSRARTPIVAMTANAFDEDRRAAFDAGMDAYASKPIEPASLMQTIGMHLKK